MPKSPDKSTIQQTPTGQIWVTVPRPLAEAMRLKKGQKAHWRVTGKCKLEITLE